MEGKEKKKKRNIKDVLFCCTNIITLIQFIIYISELKEDL